MICELLDELHKPLNDEDTYRYLICIENIFKTLKSIDESYYTRLSSIKDTIKSMKHKFKIMDILERR